MIDLYLRFASKEEADLLLEDLGIIDKVTGVILNTFSIDVIGTIYKVDESDPENPISIPKEGWHINARIRDSEYDISPLVPFLVSPEEPDRVWA